MRLLNRFVDWLVDSFGSGPFLIIYNVGTLFWFVQGRYNPHWFDPFPSNFYTFLVSWLAINMTSFVLWRQNRTDKKDREIIEAILHLTESNQRILQFLVKHFTGEGMNDER